MIAIRLGLVLVAACAAMSPATAQQIAPIPYSQFQDLLKAGKVDDTLVTTSDALIATIRSYRPGDTVTVTWLRDGQEKSAELVLDSD